MSQVAAISQQIWDMKYRFKSADGQPVDKTLADTWRRVATSVAEAEAPELRAEWAETFEAAMADLEFLPAGRIIAAGAR